VSSWLRRVRQPQPPVQQESDEEHDSPDKLRLRLWALVQFINRSAGRLPVEAVVLARQVTDTVREAIETSAERALDVYAVVQINGIVDDYLPTTLHAYLNLEPDVTDRPGPSGRTPRAALREQLEALRTAAEELLHAARSHDADLLFSQGNFLRTKFTRSDLDL
jgi:excinuclease UvrABC helicase subunit UvrB